MIAELADSNSVSELAIDFDLDAKQISKFLHAIAILYNEATIKHDIFINTNN
jgi:hypothetical protein